MYFCQLKREEHVSLPEPPVALPWVWSPVGPVLKEEVEPCMRVQLKLSCVDCIHEQKSMSKLHDIWKAKPKRCCVSWDKLESV